MAMVRAQGPMDGFWVAWRLTTDKYQQTTTDGKTVEDTVDRAATGKAWGQGSTQGTCQGVGGPTWQEGWPP